MKVRQRVAQILLEGNINHNIREISAKVQELGTEDEFHFRTVPGGIWIDEVEEFLGQAMLFGFVGGQGYTLTPEGRKLCEEMVAEAQQREQSAEDSLSAA